MKNLFCTTIAIVTFGLPAFAGGLSDPVTEQAPVAVMTSAPQITGWGGPYAGGQIASVRTETAALLSDLFVPEDLEGLDPDGLFDGDTVDFELNGRSYGLHVGYMHDVARFVLGAEMDYDLVDFDKVSASLGEFTAAQGTDGDGAITRLKLRAGYNAGRILPYATAGLARLEIESDTTGGTFIGAGAAVKATANMLVSGEALRHQFNDAFGTGFDLDATTWSLRASYRF